MTAISSFYLLDIHYSDKWTGPANQWKPKAWELHGFDLLNDKVFNYTYFALSKLKEQDTLPDMVQIGSEYNPGMLWNDGNVIGEFDTEESGTAGSGKIEQNDRLLKGRMKTGLYRKRQ